MKIPKLKFDKATLQEFFFQHVEKIVLGTVVVLLGLFVWQGTQLERMKSDFDSPQKLDTLTQNTQRKITAVENWDVLADDRKVEADVRQKAAAVTRPISGNVYRPPVDLLVQEFPRIKPRQDPQAFPPTKLTVTALHGPLALRPKGVGAGELAGGMTNARSTDPLSDTVSVGDMSGNPYGGYGEVAPPGALSGGETVRKSAREREREYMENERKRKQDLEKARKDMQKQAKNRGKAGYDDYEGDYRSSESPTGPTANAATGARMFERDRGYVAGAGCDWETGRAVVVQAVVPWQKEFDEYRRCLEDAADFQPDRDLPHYLTYMVQRADVTADPDADPATLKWEVPVYNNRAYTATMAQYETFRWHGFPSEILDSEYLDIELTHPAPPFMMRDLTSALIHPDIPVFSAEQAMAEAMAGQGQVQQYDAFGNPIDAPEGVVPMNPIQGSTQMRQSSTFQHKQPTVGQAGQPGGERSGYMPAMGGTSGTMEQIEQQVRQYKLIRFTDVTVMPGRVYRYRIKVILEDPNHPKDPAREPAIASLEDPVKLRLKEVLNKEALNAARDPNKIVRRLYWIESDWSEASPPITLPDLEHYYASAVQPPKTSPVRADRPPAVAKDAVGKMVAVTWDKKHSVDVPVVVEVERGAAVNFQGETQVIHPAEGSIRKLTDFALTEASVVADIAGGEIIAAQSPASGTSLVAPGELLVFDDRGNWHMMNEARDADEINRHILDSTLLGESAEAAATGPGATSRQPFGGRPPNALPFRGE